MSRISIDRYDKNRVLLTELLPYEVPLLFSNDGFYEIVSSDDFPYFYEKIKFKPYKELENSGKFGIPFNYEIARSKAKKTRKLSVIHPVNQLAFIDLYERYKSLIIYLTSKSPFSLRHPSSIAKYFYSSSLVFEEETQKHDDAEIDPLTLGKETKILKSFFSYKPIDLIYKFFERHQYRRLEQRFQFMLQLDISKCFYNIYTHSLTWAVKGKEIAKSNHRRKSFENRFDKIMQLANFNETNGIVVGPEISRIFAEIILQDIDMKVLSKLKSEGLKYRSDFEIKRYVDDYFIFSNDVDLLNTIGDFLKIELEEYKLYINESKTKIVESPFLTKIAVGKRELKVSLKSLFDELILETEQETEAEKIEKVKYLNPNIGKPYTKSHNFIKEFQAIVKRNDLSYEILSKDVVRSCKSQVVRVFKSETKFNDKEIEKFLLIVLDISFYAYSLNINSSSTFKLSQTIVIICKYLTKQKPDVQQTIFSKIFTEANFVINIFANKSNSKVTNIETLNLIIALTKLGEAYSFSPNRLISIFDLNAKEPLERLNYFTIIVLLYYIKSEDKYNEIKVLLEKVILSKFSKANEPFKYAELTLLFFDTISCPYISQNTKEKLMRITKYETNKNEAKEIDKINSFKSWFMDWEKEIDLERILKKKEWSSSY